MINSLVSVIIPTHNRSTTISRTIESVLSQTYKPIELIVVDDGSTDDTVEVLEYFQRSIKLVRQDNRGPSSARNLGARLSSGEVISFLDSDDTWHPEKIERQMRLLSHSGLSVSCCICNATVIENNRIRYETFKYSNVNCTIGEGYWINPSELIASRFLLFNQVVAIRRCAFERLGGFNEKLSILEDHDFAFRLSMLGPWAFIGDSLVNKYNDNTGVGVAAMRSKSEHVCAWEKALLGCLRNLDTTSPKLKRLLEKQLLYARSEKYAVGLTTTKKPCSVILGNVLLIILRIRNGIHRRRSSFPRVQAVPVSRYLEL